MAYISLFVTVLIWGFSYIVMKEATAQYPKDLFQFWRYMLAAALYAVICHKSLRNMKAELWTTGLFRLGLANFVLAFFSIYALQYTTPTRIVMINSLIVGVVPLLQYIHYKISIGLHEKIAVGIALAATAFLAEPYKPALHVGDGLALIGMAGYAYSIVIMNRLLQKEQASVIQVSFLNIAGTAVYFGLVAVFYGLVHSEWLVAHVVPTDVRTFAAMAYMIVFVSLLSGILQLIGQRRVSPVAVALMFCLEPAITAVMDYAMLGNVPSAGIVISSILLVSATLMVSMKKESRREMDSAK